MLQCPYCAHRIFETDMHSATRIRLTGLQGGDYREEEIASYDRDWGTLECTNCARHCDENEAREAFEAAGEEVEEDDPEEETVACTFCHKQVSATAAHLHQGSWVGDDCCWNERLRSTA